MLSDLSFRLRALLRRKAVETELNDELRFHIEELTEQYMESGLTRKEAQRRARLAFGGLDQVREECREAWGVRMIETLFQDIRFSLRMLRKSPGFTIVAVLTLALGIGANTAIFSVVNAVLLRPLAYKDSPSLVNIWGKFEADGLPQNWISEPEYWDLLDHDESFAQIAAYALGGSANLTRADARPVQVSEANATADVFRLLGITTVLGRTFSADEDQPGHSHFALLSYSLWQSQFAGDANILSKSIQLDGETYSVVGVLSKQFSLGGRQDLWVPLGLDRVNPGDRGSHYLHVVARLKPGMNFAQASASLTRFAGDLRRTYPKNYGQQGEKSFTVFMVPVKEQLVGKLRPALLVLLGAVTFVLLIACANVANLLLAHASSREKELAVRAALGAGRARIMRQLLTESLFLALLGGLLGLVLAYWGVGALRVLIPANTPRMDEIQLDPLVLAFTFVVSLLTGLFFGLAPAWHIARTDLRETLNEAGRGASASAGSRRLRGVLVVSELALAVLLLVGAGLLMRSFSRLLGVSPGFQTQHLLTLEISLPEKIYPDGAPVQNFFKQLMARVNVVPGIQAAGGVSQMPLSESYTSGTVIFEDTSIPDIPRAQELGNLPYMEIDQRAATPGYFQAMRIPLAAGRLLNDADDAGSPLVAVVDANFAHRFWPH
ncbi:MAG TPA: ABC transporter permease, partial [Candidatus Acidoferrum sp.]|nr:ABC transporter permease [Candidatus Acidoferrum sp.]